MLYFERKRKLKCQPELASEESSRYERLQETSHDEDSGGKVGLVLDSGAQDDPADGSSMSLTYLQV